MKIIIALFALLFATAAYAHEPRHNSEPKVRIHIDLGFHSHSPYYYHRHYHRPPVIVVPGYIYREHHYYRHHRHDDRRRYRR